MNKLTITFLLILSWNFIYCQDEYEFSAVIVIPDRDKKIKVKVPSKLINPGLTQLIEMPTGNPRGSQLTIIADHNLKRNRDKFSNLDIGYEIVSRNGIGVKGELNLSQNLEVDGTELFSLYPYRRDMNRFIIEDVFLKITYLKINGQVVDVLPDKTKLKIELTASPPEKNFESTSDFLLENSIIPNHTAIDLLFQYNSVLFEKKKLSIKKLGETNIEILTPPIGEVFVDIPDLIPQSQNGNPNLILLTQNWETITNRLKKRHFRSEKKKKKKEVNQVKKILDNILNGGHQISNETLYLLISDCKLVLAIFDETIQSKRAMPLTQWNIYHSLIEDIESIAEVVESEKLGISNRENNDSYYEGLTLTNVDFSSFSNVGNSHSQFTTHFNLSNRSLDTYLLIVSTYENLPPRYKKNGLVIKAMPSNHRKYRELKPEKYDDMFGKRFIKEFVDESTPTFRLLPPGKWHLWSEQKLSNGIFKEVLKSETNLNFLFKIPLSAEVDVKVKSKTGDDLFYKSIKRYLHVDITN